MPRRRASRAVKTVATCQAKLLGLHTANASNAPSLRCDAHSTTVLRAASCACRPAKRQGWLRSRRLSA